MTKLNFSQTAQHAQHHYAITYASGTKPKVSNQFPSWTKPAKNIILLLIMNFAENLEKNNKIFCKLTSRFSSFRSDKFTIGPTIFI